MSIDIDMLLMVEKGIRGEMCHAIHRYKQIIKTRKIMINTKNHHVFNI